MGCCPSKSTRSYTRLDNDSHISSDSSVSRIVSSRKDSWFFLENTAGEEGIPKVSSLVKHNYMGQIKESGLLESITKNIQEGSIEMNFSLLVKYNRAHEIDHRQSFYEGLYELLRPIETNGGHIVISTSPIIRGEEYRVFHINGPTTYVNRIIFYIKIRPDASQEPILPYQYGNEIIYQTISAAYYREKGCVICYERLANVLYRSCGHLQVCYNCQTNKKDPTYKATSEGRSVCPICFSQTGRKNLDWIHVTREDLIQKYPIIETFIEKSLDNYSPPLL